MERWQKSAEPYFSNGELIPWEQGCVIELAKGLRHAAGFTGVKQAA
jgi:hypothetical protein